MHRGWTRNWRKKIDSRLAGNVNLWFLFDQLVLRARSSPGWVSLPTRNAPLKLERGQLIVGRKSLHEMIARAYPRNKPSDKTVWRWLLLLKKGGEVSLEVSNAFTIITINNYGLYNDTQAENVQANVPSVSQACPESVPSVSTNKNHKNHENEKNDQRNHGDGVVSAKLKGVTEAALSDDAAMAGLFLRAVRLGIVRDSDQDRLRFWGAAVHALRVGDEPPRLFAWTLYGARWDHITAEDEDRAAARLKAMKEHG